MTQDLKIITLDPPALEKDGQEVDKYVDAFINNEPVRLVEPYYLEVTDACRAIGKALKNLTTHLRHIDKPLYFHLGLDWYLVKDEDYMSWVNREAEIADNPLAQEMSKFFYEIGLKKASSQDKGILEFGGFKIQYERKDGELYFDLEEFAQSHGINPEELQEQLRSLINQNNN